MTRGRRQMQRWVIAAGVLTLLGSEPAVADSVVGIRSTSHSDSAGWIDAGQATTPVLTGVLDRPRAGYEPHGIRLGTFTLYTGLASTAAYDSNVLATRKSRSNDIATRLTPSFLLRSGWRENEFALYGALERVAYREFDSDNQVNGHVGMRGTLHVRSDLRLRGYADWMRTHEDRGTAEASLAGSIFDKPLQRDTLATGLAVDKRFNRFTASVGGSYQHLDFADGSVGGVPVSQSYRSGDIYTTKARLAYEISPKVSIFTEGGYEWRTFDDSALDSQGTRLLLGFSTELTRLMRGEVYAGYLGQTFDTVGVRDISTYTYGGHLRWYATPLMTVSFVGERNIKEAAYATTGTYIQSQAGMRIDYELRRNVILSARGGLEWDDYQQAARRDLVKTLGLSGTYLINRNVHVSLDYRFTDRDSSVDLFDYTRSIIALTTRLQY